MTNATLFHCGLSVAVCASALFGALSCSDSEPSVVEKPQTFEVGALEGPDQAFVDQEVCFTLDVNPTDAARSLTWGDGSESTQLCHTYGAPGRYRVDATVSSAGQQEVRSRELLVLYQPLGVPPTSSSSMALDPQGDGLWVVNPDNDSISLLDAHSLELQREFSVCAHPRSLAISGAFVAVVCQDSDEVWQLERLVPSDAKRTQLPPGSAPFGIVGDPRGRFFYVSEQASGGVVSIGVGDSVITSTLQTPADARGLGMLPDGRLFVTHWRASDTGSRVSVVTSNEAGRLDDIETLALLPDADGVLGFMNQVALEPSGRAAWLPALHANNQAGLFRTGMDLTPKSTAHAAVGVLDIPSSGATPGEAAGGRLMFDDLDLVSAVSFSPDGARAFMAIQGSDQVLVIDTTSKDVVGSVSSVGTAPDGLALSKDGVTLYVHGFLSRSVQSYDVSQLDQPEAAFMRRGTTIEQEALSPEVLAGKQLFYSASDSRLSAGNLSCASCHSDGEGDNLTWDLTGHGEGLRNTIPLRGRGGVDGSGALNWSANWDEVQDIEGDIRQYHGGTGFLTDSQYQSVSPPLGAPKLGLSADLDALAAYVGSLKGWGTSPFRQTGSASWEASRARGKLLFESTQTGCRSCHSGPQFSDSAFDAPGVPHVHDVGTLSVASGARLGGPLLGLDTPSLRGLWKSAPYLHDGSALTLRDVLTTRNPGDLHGITSGLSSQDVADLEAYLLTLDDMEP